VATTPEGFCPDLPFVWGENNLTHASKKEKEKEKKKKRKEIKIKKYQDRKIVKNKKGRKNKSKADQ